MRPKQSKKPISEEEKRINDEALEWLDEVIAAQKKHDELKKIAENSLKK